jgi:hypothetical protein
VCRLCELLLSHASAKAQLAHVGRDVPQDHLCPCASHEPKSSRFHRAITRCIVRVYGRHRLRGAGARQEGWLSKVQSVIRVVDVTDGTSRLDMRSQPRSSAGATQHTKGVRWALRKTLPRIRALKP